MFTRLLNTLRWNCLIPSSHFPGTLNRLRPPSSSGWMGRPHWYPLTNPGKFPSFCFRPPRVRLRLVPFSSCSYKAVRLSCAVMDHADREPPQKRMRSADRRNTSPTHRSGPRISSPPPMRSPNSWFPRGSTDVASPETKPQKTFPTTEIKRQWEDFCHHYNPASTEDLAFDFSVMSYNILSQDLLQDNAYLYKHCHMAVLDWSHRLPSLLRELQKFNADIMCLQEVQEDHYLKEIKPSLDSLGYHSEYKRRTGHKPDGCVVSFKRERFSLVSCHPVEFYRRGIPLLDRDNVGLVLLLRPTVGPAPAPFLCVANTHLLYNPRRGDIKLAQLAMLLAEISRVSRPAVDTDDTPCPVILCGDFNSVPWSPLYSFIRDSQLDYEGIPIGKVSGQEQSPRGQRILTRPIWPRSLGVNERCQYETMPATTPAAEGNLSDLSVQQHTEALDDKCQPRIEHGLRLTSAYSHYLKDCGQPEITTCHARTAITVDYIFYSPARGDVSVQPECSTAPKRGLQLLARLGLVSESELWTANGLPNEHNCSDHLPLLARFRMCC